MSNERWTRYGRPYPGVLVLLGSVEAANNPLGEQSSIEATCAECSITLRNAVGDLDPSVEALSARVEPLLAAYEWKITRHEAIVGGGWEDGVYYEPGPVTQERVLCHICASRRDDV